MAKAKNSAAGILDAATIEAKVRLPASTVMSHLNQASPDRKTGPTVRDIDKQGHFDIATLAARAAEQAVDIFENSLTPEQADAMDVEQRLNMLRDAQAEVQIQVVQMELAAAEGDGR